jgi:hypothetical protein
MLHVEVAPRIIDRQVGLTCLIRLKDIFLKVSGDSGAALVDTAPCGDRMLTNLIDIGLEIVAHLTNDEHLFVFHDAFAMLIFEESLNVILHFALGPLVHLVTHKLETGWEVRRKHKLERDRVVTWHELRDADHVAGVLEMQNFSLSSSLDLTLLLSSINIVSFCVHPAHFLSSLNLDHDLSGGSGNLKSNVDCSSDHSAWIIDLTCSLHCQVSVFTPVARV